MNRKALFFICLFIIELIIVSTNDDDVFYYRESILLPMKKNHKYGDDICLYREEVDKKRDYNVYYVKPCEKGKYCETDYVDAQPFGFCRDIPTNPIEFSTYEGACSTNGECLDDLKCVNGKCQYVCYYTSLSPFNLNSNEFDCYSSTQKTTVDGEHCVIYEEKYNTADPKQYNQDDTEETATIGKYPGLPKECGIINYKSIPDVDPNGETVSGTTTYKSYTRWIIANKKWCSIGEAEDGVFVDSWKYCKSGFTLKFYPKGDLEDPSYRDQNNNLITYHGGYLYQELPKEMCVTPIQIDKNNPEAEVVVTYKIKDGDEQKYNYKKYYHNTDIEQYAVIKSQLYTEFIGEFNNASEEDKKNCYKIEGELENCQNIKLLKLHYFYNHIKEYLFYKNREDLEKVLNFKIQKEYHWYYEFSSYLNLNYLFLLLFLIIL